MDLCWISSLALEFQAGAFMRRSLPQLHDKRKPKR